jgi:two-component system sensor histidine kinase RpfC
MPAVDETIADIAAHPRFKGEARAIDATTIEQLRELGGPTFLSELAREFLDEGERIIEEIDASVAADDYDRFRDRIHALRSGAANIGAMPLYQLCLSLRAIGGAAFAASGAEKARELADEFARVRRELAHYPLDPGRAGADPAGAEPAAPYVEMRRAAGDGIIRPLRPPGPTSAGSAPR